MMKILVADDHELMREAIVHLLCSQWPLIAIDCAGSYDEALACINEGDASHAYNLILLDLHMPGMRGVESVAALVTAAGVAPVIVLTGIEAPDLLYRLRNTGVRQVFNKTVHASELLRAISMLGATFQTNIQTDVQSHIKPHEVNVVAEHIVPLPVDAVSLPHDANLPDAFNGMSLTQRQLDVLRLLHLGKPNKIIARELDVALGTVKNHLSVLFAKLQVNSRAEAIAKTRKWFI